MHISSVRNFSAKWMVLLGCVGSAIISGYIVSRGYAVGPILGGVIFFGLFLTSLKSPMVIMCVYPLSFIDAFQDRLMVGGVTPGIYLGILVFIVFLSQVIQHKVILRDIPRTWLALLCFFPLLLLGRFLVAGSDLRVILTFGGQILVAISYLALLRNPNRVYGVIVSIIVVSLVMSVGQIMALFWSDTLDMLTTSLQHGEYLRVAGLARDPNYAALLMNIGYSYALGLALGQSKSGKRLRATVLSSGAVLLAIGVVLTASRGGLLALAVVNFLFLAMPTSGRKRALLAVPLVFVVVWWASRFFANDLVIGIFARSAPDFLLNDPSNVARLAEVEVGITRLMHGDIWLGVGDPELTYHNTYIDLLSFAGIPALISFLAVFLRAIFANLDLSRRRLNTSGTLALSNVAAIISLLIVGSAIGIEFEKVPWLVLAVGLATVLCYQTLRADCQSAPAMDWENF
ncbi:MAG: O-antigen ligase family protein [Anaerolineae bacterium]|nr:O-antigen ligase family protein [Anaerolineae bacterium]